MFLALSSSSFWKATETTSVLNAVIFNTKLDIQRAYGRNRSRGVRVEQHRFQCPPLKCVLARAERETTIKPAKKQIASALDGASGIRTQKKLITFCQGKAINLHRFSSKLSACCRNLKEEYDAHSENAQAGPGA
jgi:hypothetical protein